MNKSKKDIKTSPTSSKTAASPPPKVGELLINEGFATPEDIQKALDIQKEEQELAKLPLGKILINMGTLTEDDLEQALNHPELRKNLGSLAVKKGLIRKEDLELVLKKKEPGQTVGELLINYGLLTHNNVGNLLKDQIDSPKLGQVLLDLKLIKESSLREALTKQRSTRALGEILCDLKVINPQNLHYILEKYNKQVEIEEILLKFGYIDIGKLNDAKKEMAGKAITLEEVLIKKKFITSEELQRSRAIKYNLPFEPLTNFTYSRSDKEILTNFIQQKYAEKNMLLPLTLQETKLTIAVFQPEKMNFLGELHALYPNMIISFVLTTQEKFEELFEVLFSKRLSRESQKPGESQESDDIDFMEIDLDENLNENDDSGTEYGRDKKDIEAEEIVNFIVKYGILNDASDIHIEQDRSGPSLRFRIDGVLQDPNIGWLKRKMAEKISAVISRIKVMSNLDIAEKRIPQDGVFRTSYYDKAKNQKFDLDFRVATCRAIVGENATIRILDSRKANVALEDLNHSPHVAEPFKRLLQSSAGMVLVSGPTGSGKSSTLYAALRFIYNPGLKIITAEDPIEYSFPGIMQTQINPKINLTFSRLLRSFLRLDPDVILVGEVRDEETATIGFDAAQTGHLLLSTIHTNDSIRAISRLADLNIEYKQIASCLLGILAQRLVRKICPFCKKEYVPPENEWELLFSSYPTHLKFYKGEGCETCKFTGYKGRIIVSEIFVIDNEIGLALSKGLDDSQLKKIAFAVGMKTMLEDGLLKLQDTTLSELLRLIPHDMITTFRTRNKAHKKAEAAIEIDAGGAGPLNRDVITPQSYLVSHPESQNQVIDEMFQKYSTINSAYNRRNDADISLFNDFITDNFYKLCEKHNCSHVNFMIQNINRRAEISAMPENR